MHKAQESFVFKMGGCGVVCGVMASESLLIGLTGTLVLHTFLP